ncbi:hypothetical protein ACU4GH_18900 [Bradyrhizobium betae]
MAGLEARCRALGINLDVEPERDPDFHEFEWLDLDQFEDVQRDVHMLRQHEIAWSIDRTLWALPRAKA